VSYNSIVTVVPVKFKDLEAYLEELEKAKTG